MDLYPFKEFVISTELTAPSTHDLALAIAAAADSKKASNIVIVDMRGLVAYTDYLVIATGQTAPVSYTHLTLPTNREV